MNTQLATQPNQELQQYPDYVPVAGLQDLSADDFTLPALKLCQAQSKIDEAIQHIGQWYRQDTGEFFANPRLLILGIAKSRVLFDAYTGENKDPLCRSDDAISPRGGGGIALQVRGKQGVTGTKCDECPFSQWDGDDAPLCSLTENWAALSEQGDPVVLRLNRTAMAASRQLKNLARSYALKHKPLYVELTSKAEKGTKGNYYVPLISISSEPPFPELLEMGKQFSGLNLAARAAQQDEHGEEIAPDTDGDNSDYQVHGEVPPGIDIPF